MNICVFCGSASGTSPTYSEAAQALGSLIGANGHTLVYGGGNIGLMGVLADAVLAAQGHVVGVIPDFLLKREVAHLGLTELIVVNSMHERKQKMANLAHVFLAMAGGWGTLDELAEILTWRQLHIVDKPIGILNTEGFFSPLLAMMNSMVNEGFLSAHSRRNLIEGDTPKTLLTALGVELR